MTSLLSSTSLFSTTTAAFSPSSFALPPPSASASASSLNLRLSPSTIDAQAPQAGRTGDIERAGPPSPFDPPLLSILDEDEAATSTFDLILPHIPGTAAPVAAPLPTSTVPDGLESASARTSWETGQAGGATRTKDRAVPIVTATERAGGSEAGSEVEEKSRSREKRWEGWDTQTETVYVTNTAEVPTAITLYTTYGESPVVDGGTTTETIYKGADTVTVLGPSYLTITFYPTTTTYSTSRTTIPTTTKTKTKTYPNPAQATATVCNKGDADQKEFTGLKPTHDQSITLYVIAISVGWNLFLLRDLLYPFKVFTVAIHEVGHVLITICLGYRIGVLIIDPKAGGLTRMVFLDDREHPIPFPALPMGYLFNIFIGGLLTFCGFDTLASKIASFIVGLCWIGVFLRVEIPAKIMTLGAVGLMVGLWFVDHAWGLRFYILFMGVMSSFYVLWDVADDAFFAKQNPCCPALMHVAMPALSPGIWTIIWFLLSFLFFVGFILAGLAAWKQSPHAVYCQAQTWLPT
ncbi:hypothetical protein JCM8097_008454 [Rhodosporidiobolus ruineniae]